MFGSIDMRPVKIGHSYDPEQRSVVIQPDCPFPLQVLWRYEGGGVDLETALHREFKRYHLHHEWFDFGNEDPVAAVSAAVPRLMPAVIAARQRRLEKYNRAQQTRRARRPKLDEAGLPRSLVIPENWRTGPHRLSYPATTIQHCES